MTLNIRHGMHTSRTSLSDFRCPERIAGFEGGAIYFADEDGKFFLIINETALLDFLNDDDRDGFQPITVMEFSTSTERQHYASARGWIQIRNIEGQTTFPVNAKS